ncbi:hypothetical protein CK503_04060 [Aliifodinibius salipaludis]|uniref:Type I restriction modification DNA specificity domain-containing protein n=1 Tax=Fodinibius salipaludis TaxID=2032627 RepID=A0A2A2GEN0_9BACT|nr:restriction endonuclease subunit S [Aliifodinibius salipaludis]PAU95377.1 hypothetical protein CK503_04060 [Aliifodinibius salipaludis]
MEVVTDKPAKNSVPEEYKRTEVGVIPNDWEMRLIKDLAHIGTGAKNTEDKIDDGRYPFFVRSSKVERINSYSFDGEAVLTAGDGVNTGKIFHYINGKFDYHQRVYKISNFNNDIDGYYFYLAFSQYFYERVMGMTAKSSVDSVRMEMIADMKLPFPPTLEEQQAIAEALSDVDALIAELNALIEKKQQVKKGTMQQLLTGKKRLPGFDGEWEEKTLGEVCISISDGTHYTPSYVDYGIPFYSVENVTADNYSDVKYISKTEHEKLIKRCKPERGDVLLTRIGTLGKTKLIDWDIDASIYVSLALLKLSDKINTQYFYRYTESEQFVEEVKKRALTNASPQKINMGELEKVSIVFPKDEEEQKAIAQILSDMDAEIKALESKRDKYKQIKQGMMQELLTGKTRLVKAKEERKELQESKQISTTHSWAFNEAVIIATLADQFGDDIAFGRKRYTKLSYLLHRYTDNEVSGYRKKAAGPYNPKTKYGGPERIALEKEYMGKAQKGKYKGFVSGENIEEAQSYFDNWYGQEAINWIDENFRYQSNDDLELLTTVDKARIELGKEGQEVTLSTVKEVIASHPEWESKLERDIFSDENIKRAINESYELFG